jgi:hypothetical protein
LKLNWPKEWDICGKMKNGRSEVTAMAFQTANSSYVGNQTAGADGDVVIFEYIGGYTAISGNGVLYPMEQKLKEKLIDIEIKPTIKRPATQGKVSDFRKLAIEIAKSKILFPIAILQRGFSNTFSFTFYKRFNQR